ncbi:MAG: phosphoribosyl transferase [Candidatus Nephthysia bennettiae]|nr:MAG: phosphoribosyl transferase [Candidatus Dormibacteraeota bacterium]
MRLPFADRTQAGRMLATRLEGFARQGRQPIVLGLPRGGVPVAFEVAQALRLPLDVYLVRKLGTPGFEELAMGAIATGGIQVLNEKVIEELHITSGQLDAVLAAETAELLRREGLYRRGRACPQLEGRTAILVDDGLATGSTMRAAIASLRAQRAWEVIVAVPVAPPDTCAELNAESDGAVCLATPRPFMAVGQWYEEFSPPSDDEIRDQLLANARDMARSEE